MLDTISSLLIISTKGVHSIKKRKKERKKKSITKGREQFVQPESSWHTKNCKKAPAGSSYFNQLANSSHGKSAI